MYNAFDTKFHLIESVELGKDSFVLNGAKYDVPCVFQLWIKKDIDRPMDEKIHPSGFSYVKSTDDYHIALRRVGATAGKCYKNTGKDYSIQSHYFIKFDRTILDSVEQIIEKINNHTFPSNTVGPRSLSKTEINGVVNRIIHSASAGSVSS
jgi:hypothetical protein